MSKSSILVVGFFVLAFLVGCIKNDDKIWAGAQGEFDATSWNSNSAGIDYPIMTRIPRYDFVTGTGDSVLRRYSGTVRLRVNLIGATSKESQTIGYRVINSPLNSPEDSIVVPSTIAGQTPSMSSGKVKVLNAIAGTHYAPLSGKVTIPADSSFGYIIVQILNAGPATGEGRFLGFQLDSTGTLKPATNYSRLGLVIDQR
jgi:hypothetical protein